MNVQIFLPLAAAVFILLQPAVLPAAPGDTIAKVNGAAITEADVESQIDRLVPQGSFHGGMSENTRASYREKALENAIDQELQYQDAVSRGMKPDTGKVAAYIKKTKSDLRSDKEYKEALFRAGITEEQFRQRIVKGMLAAEVMQKIMGAQPVTDAEVKDHYEKNLASFKRPESVRLRLMSTKNEKKAGEMLSLVAAKQDFGAVAAKMSEDKYRIKGGDIGYIHRGRVLPEIEAEAFKLEPGETSGLIKAGNMWFIIRVEDRKSEHQATYEEAREKLKKHLAQKRNEELKQKWMSDLRAKAKIEMVQQKTEQ